MIFDFFNKTCLYICRTPVLPHMNINMLLKVLGAALALIGILVVVNLTSTETPTNNTAVQFAVGTASDPALQQPFDPAQSVICSIAHITKDSTRQGKRIAFLQDTTSGKFICIHADKQPAVTALNVGLVPESFVGPLNVPHSYPLPDNTEWSQHWLSNPKYPNLWVLGLIEK